MIMNKMIELLKKYWKKLFCYILIVLGILFTVVLLIYRPMRVNTEYVYQYSNKIIQEEGNFPIMQHVTFQQDNLKVLNIYFRDSSVEGKSYLVKLLDNDGREYFKFDYVFDKSSMISIPLDNLNLEKNFDYILMIECDSCTNTQFSVKDSNSSGIFLEGFNGKTLEMTVHYVSKNNSYFWYSIMMIAIALTLLPIARRDYNEKDKF